MKVILAGSTGFIGAEVLKQALSHPSVTSVVALSRRELPNTNPKLKTVILKDFSSYPSNILGELEGADACIWSLGVKIADSKVQRQVTIDYTAAAMEAFSRLSSSNADANAKAKSPFRLVFASGFLAVRDQTKSLWFMGDTRRLKGEAETFLLDFTASHKESLDAFIVRPGGVLVHCNPILGMPSKLFPSVEVAELAATMVDLAVNGAEEKILENDELVRRGRMLLKK